MIYKVRVIADLEEDVIRDIAIRSTANLEDLHNTIVNAFDFDGSEMASFYLSDKEWNQGDEIPLDDVSDDADSEVKTMSDYKLADLFKEQNDKLIYVYDFYLMWTFLIELIEITTYNKERDLPKILYSLGNLPQDAPEKEFVGEKIEEGFEEYNDDFDDDLDDDEGGYTENFDDEYNFN